MKLKKVNFYEVQYTCYIEPTFKKGSEFLIKESTIIQLE